MSCHDRAPHVQSRRLRQSDRKSTRLNSSHTEIYTLSLHDALPIYRAVVGRRFRHCASAWTEHELPRSCSSCSVQALTSIRSEEHTSELQSHRDLHSFPTRRSSDLQGRSRPALSPLRKRLD